MPHANTSPRPGSAAPPPSAAVPGIALLTVLAAMTMPAAAGGVAPEGLLARPGLLQAGTPGSGSSPGRSETRARHATMILAGTSAALAVYGKRQWWRDGFRSRFSATSEGWFGPDTYSGGADKLGHFYMTYASLRLLTRLLEWDGAGHDVALRTAGWYTLGAYAAIEVLDGLSRNWRFSHEDMLMNAAGVAAAVALERYPGLDRKLDVRVLYRPSREEGRRFDPFGDYSGQTYLIVTRLAGFDAISPTSWARFVELSAGYGTRGFERAAGRPGQRNVYVGVSLNLSQLLTGPAGGRAGRAHAFARTTLEFVQLPGTALLARHCLPPAAHSTRGAGSGAPGHP